MPKVLTSALISVAAMALGCSATPRTLEPTASAQPAAHVLASSSAADAGVPTTHPAVVASAAEQFEPSDIITPFKQLTLDGAIEDRAKANPKEMVPQLDLQLLRLISDRPPESADTLPQDERQVLTILTDALANFRRSAGEQSRLETKIEPLKDLSERLKAAAPMTIPTLALCRSVTQFGQYDSFDPPRFTAGQETPVIIYCELDNFLSRAASDGRWETKLSYEAVLYTDGDAGVSVISKKPTNIVDRCRNRRRDFFLADRRTLPSALPVGRYLLKVTVIDRAANHVAERTLPIQIAPN